ncbi:MAG: iron dependent repressor, metal binding and dimerization domain protein [Eubacteriales bacterium]
MLSPSLEDYLEEVYRFSLNREVVRVTDISRKLGVSLPSVSKALSKLREKEYINYEPYGRIELTEKGKELGDFLVDRNKLLQEFLSLIVASCDIEAEAEAMEHYLSRETIEAISDLVSFLNEKPKCYREYINRIENKKQKTKNEKRVQ